MGDPQPPGVLFWRGDIRWLRNPCVAIVGTRRATPDGRTVAFELGRDLASAGVCVISGLALGIDGAAHRGAVSAQAASGSAGPIGIAASGVDVPYPRSHAALWERVVSAGAVVSETPPGRPAQAWRFPSRNRVIAALVRMVVVVESHASGGSLITAEQAMSRGVDVRVVPGPVHSPASAGSNQLLYDGPGPVRDARDVLDGLGMIVPASPPPSFSSGSEWSVGADPELSSLLAAVVGVTGWRPSSVDQIVERSGLPVASVMSSLDVLEATGWVERHGDWWVRHRRG
jgi:DNA processing protein